MFEWCNFSEGGAPPSTYPSRENHFPRGLVLRIGWLAHVTIHIVNVGSVSHDRGAVSTLIAKYWCMGAMRGDHGLIAIIY